MLRPGPLDIGGLFSATFAAFKRRFGTLVLITLLPMLVGAALLAGSVAVAVVVIALGGVTEGRSIPLAIVVGVLATLAGVLVMVLAQLKSQGMIAQAAYEIAQGGEPDFRGVFARTRGFLPRLAPVILIFAGAVLVLYAVVAALALGAVGAAMQGTGSRSGGAILGVFGAIALMVVVLIPVSLFLSTKLLYTLPATAIEQLGGIDAMKRSWRLTTGSFWRTLGYYLVAAIAAYAAASVVGTATQVLTLPLAGITRDDRPAQAIAALTAMIPMLLLAMLLQFAVQLLTVPFLHTYITYMYIDQVRRAELPAAPSGYQGPPYYAQPGQYYGQYPPAPPQQYPQQFPPQGQPYPPQTSWQPPNPPVAPPTSGDQQ